MTLTVYGDFNCPFSALASHRIDRLHETGKADVDFRAVERNPDYPLDGEALVGEKRKELEEEVEQVLGLLTPGDGEFHLRVPDAIPNTATMVQSYASTPTSDLRRELYAAVWGDAVAAGVVTADGTARQAEWQNEYQAFEKPMVPTLVLEDGYVSRGLGALKRLADLLNS
jgi:predicted DsbA family dithiol-disulfide isomerase